MRSQVVSEKLRCGRRTRGIGREGGRVDSKQRPNRGEVSQCPHWHSMRRTKEQAELQIESR